MSSQLASARARHLHLIEFPAVSCTFHIDHPTDRVTIQVADPVLERVNKDLWAEGRRCVAWQFQECRGGSRYSGGRVRWLHFLRHLGWIPAAGRYLASRSTAVNLLVAREVIFAMTTNVRFPFDGIWIDVKCESVLVAAARRSPLRKGETPVGSTRQVLPRPSDLTNAISFLHTHLYKCAVDQHGYNTSRRRGTTSPT